VAFGVLDPRGVVGVWQLCKVASRSRVVDGRTAALNDGCAPKQRPWVALKRRLHGDSMGCGRGLARHEWCAGVVKVAVCWPGLHNQKISLMWLYGLQLVAMPRPCYKTSTSRVTLWLASKRGTSEQ
jgi:hypothetical protein